MSVERLDLIQPKEILDYRASELTLQEKYLKGIEKTLDNPELPPSIVYANRMRLEKAKATFMLYNCLMNDYVQTLLITYMDKTNTK